MRATVRSGIGRALGVGTGRDALRGTQEHRQDVAERRRGVRDSVAFHGQCPVPAVPVPAVPVPAVPEPPVSVTPVSVTFARGVPSQLRRMATVTRPTTPVWAARLSPRSAVQEARARSTAMARPYSSVSTTRHWVCGLRAARTRSWRACMLVIGPIRPSRAGSAARSVSADHGMRRSSRPAGGREDVAQSRCAVLR